MQEIKLCEGAVARLVMMQTHHQKPINFSKSAMEQAKKILEAWFKACEPTIEPFCPVEILECYCDNMNTAKAIAIMHSYRKNKQGKELFRAMKFLGFFGDIPHIHEVKTLPDDPSFGPETVSHT